MCITMGYCVCEGEVSGIKWLAVGQSGKFLNRIKK